MAGGTCRKIQGFGPHFFPRLQFYVFLVINSNYVEHSYGNGAESIADLSLGPSLEGAGNFGASQWRSAQQNLACWSFFLFFNWHAPHLSLRRSPYVQGRDQLAILMRHGFFKPAI